MHAMHIQEAAREVKLVAQYDPQRAYELAERFQRQYPNFSNLLNDFRGYQLADHLGDYRVPPQRRRWS